MKKTYILIIATFLLIGCQDSIDASLSKKIDKNEIIRSIKTDSYISNLEATYGIVFINKTKNFIFKDDFYIKQDDARVNYGFKLEDAIFDIIPGNPNTLYVKLPKAQYISTDRNTVELKYNNEKYSPVDEKGEPVNIDKVINEKLEIATLKYEPKMLDMSKQLTKSYFETIAGMFGMDLKIEFEN